MNIIQNKINEKISLSRDETCKKICDFFGIERMVGMYEDVEDNIRYLCVNRLFMSLGVKCECNLNSQFLNLFSSIVGEVVSQKLFLGYRLAGDRFRLFKYNGVNLVEEVRSYFDKDETLDEAFIDAFNLIDSYRYLINT